MIELIDTLLEIVEKEKDGFANIDDNLFTRLKETITKYEEKYKKGELSEIEEDRFKTLKILRKRLFERRFSRLVRMAMYQTLGIENVQLSNVTPAESEFFKKLVSLMEEFKKEMLD